MQIEYDFMLVVPVALAWFSGLFLNRSSTAKKGALAVFIGGLLTGLPQLLGLESSSYTFFDGWVRCDPLSAVMVILVTFLGWVDIRFACSTMEGDSRQGILLRWLSITLGFVVLLMISNHLLLLLGAWIGTSLGLHRLLVFYSGRPAAIFAARKKFFFSRCGDVCLALACFFLHEKFQTWRLDEIFSRIAEGHVTGAMTAVCFLIVWCALFKSAQFPFHSWLPDTLETPTPVSAFMHAGIVNAGGYLVLRLYPVLNLSPGALQFLAVTGSITTLFGVLVMLTQTSVKKTLAYSTIAQMGFMMIQCGLGAYALALLHIVAHSLYKAHAFLTASHTIGQPARQAIRLQPRAIVKGLAGGLLAVVTAWGLSPAHAFKSPEEWVFLWGLFLAIAYGLARAWSAGHGSGRGLLQIAAGLVIAVFIPWIHEVFSLTLAGAHSSDFQVPTLLWIAVVFGMLYLAQVSVWRWGHSERWLAFRVHVMNGFYIGTVVNKWLNRLWPSFVNQIKIVS